MLKSSPQQLAIDLLNRSVCSVQVAAVIFDNHGIAAWGWNSQGSTGFGECAEIAAIRRSNRNRLFNSSIVVVGRRKRNGNIVITFPCGNCLKRLKKVGISTVILQDKQSNWFKVRI